MPHHEEAPADQAVDLALILRKANLLCRDSRRNDGVVVADLAVVDKPLAQSCFDFELHNSGRAASAIRAVRAHFLTTCSASPQTVRPGIGKLLCLSSF